jgi:hypothetical protein
MKIIKSILTILVIVHFCACNQPKDSLKFDEDILAFQQGDYWGYIDTKGKILINPQFSAAYPFQDGVAIVESNDKYGIIDKKGAYIVQPVYKELNIFSEGLAACVKENGAIEFIDKKGEVKIKLNTDIEYAYPFHEGLACVCIGDKYGFINTKGEVVIPAKFETPSNFSEGLARVGTEDNHSFLYGYIDKKGNFVIPAQFVDASDFREGMAAVGQKDMHGYIDKKGKYVINPQYRYVSDFKHGLASYTNDGDLYGLINTKGKILVNPQFKSIGLYHNGGSGNILVQSTDNKFGYIDKTGKFVITPQYEEASTYIGEHAIITMGEKVGIIDKKGKIVVNPQFDGILAYGNLYYRLSKEPCSSDYFSAIDVANNVTKHFLKGNLLGISSPYNLSNIQKIYPNVSNENLMEYEDFDRKINKHISFKNINFYMPADAWNYIDNFTTEKVYDATTGGYTDRKVYQESTLNFDKNIPLEQLELKFNISSKAQSNIKQIHQSIIDNIKADNYKEVNADYKKTDFIFLENEKRVICLYLNEQSVIQILILLDKRKKTDFIEYQGFVEEGC